jgi:hypothetical protein
MRIRLGAAVEAACSRVVLAARRASKIPMKPAQTLGLREGLGRLFPYLFPRFWLLLLNASMQGPETG